MKSAFSLVEMLVAIAVFMSIMTVALSALISIIDSNKKAQAIKTTVDNVTFALESISRDMRIGHNYQCLMKGVTPDSWRTDCSDNGQLPGSVGVRYLKNNGGVDDGITYRFITDINTGLKSLQRSICDSSFNNCSTSFLISAESNVNLIAMTFYVLGANCEFGVGALCTDGKTQPRVVITASGLIPTKGNIVQGSTEGTEFDIQTNISQRMRGQ